MLKKKSSRGELDGCCLAVVCGRVSKVADRVKGIKRGG